MSVVAVFCNFPDYQIAREVSEKLIAKNLIACANILDGCTSVFRWQGKIEIASEIPVIFKTTLETYGKFEVELAKLHPYDVPEIVSWPVEFGNKAYLDWVAENVGQDEKSEDDINHADNQLDENDADYDGEDYGSDKNLH